MELRRAPVALKPPPPSKSANPALNQVPFMPGFFSLAVLVVVDRRGRITSFHFEWGALAICAARQCSWCQVPFPSRNLGLNAPWCMGPQRGPVMQPKGAEPWRVLPWESRPQSSTSCSRTATRSRHGRCGGAVTCGDGTSLRFVLRRGGWVARLPGEHSPRLGTPGLHDESPLGFGDYARWVALEPDFDDSTTQSQTSFRAGAIFESL